MTDYSDHVSCALQVLHCQLQYILIIDYLFFPDFVINLFLIAERCIPSNSTLSCENTSWPTNTCYSYMQHEIKSLNTGCSFYLSKKEEESATKSCLITENSN